MRARRICWPSPDATCLEGGCLYCNEAPFRALRTIDEYVVSAGVLPNRGKGETEALDAWRYGLARGFNGVEVK